MIILKSQTFSTSDTLTVFVKKNNNIARENIFTITTAKALTDTWEYAIFFYADSEVREELPGFFLNDLYM